jgi:molybdopterin/thiamine biosynthesis adenylyltransferase
MGNALIQEHSFDYDLAFSRNIGWFTPDQQKLLSQKRIAIPGLGGVGGHHLHNFLRLGFRKFNLADPDTFELKNFNRQQGATIRNIGRMKIDVAQELCFSINPTCELKLFNKGVQPENYQSFLKDVDLVVDSLDLFAMDERIELYEMAYQNGIPVVTAGPFGMGTSILGFHPKRMSFNKYFDLQGKNLTVEAKIIRFLAGVSPKIIHQRYLRFPENVNLFEKKLPSLNIGCLAASAAMGAFVVEALLDPDSAQIRWAPKGLHVDFNLARAYRFSRPWGNRNPLQILKIKAYHHFFRKPEYSK